MDSEKLARERLETHAISQLGTVGIEAEKEKDGVLRFNSSLPQEIAEKRIQGMVPHGVIETQPDGTGSTGTVKVADVKRFNE